MAKYYFVLQWPDRKHDDRHGTMLPDDRAARAYAERVVRELIEAGGYDDPNLTMVVTNAAPDRLFNSVRLRRAAAVEPVRLAGVSYPQAL